MRAVVGVALLALFVALIVWAVAGPRPPGYGVPEAKVRNIDPALGGEMPREIIVRLPKEHAEVLAAIAHYRGVTTHQLCEAILSAVAVREAERARDAVRELPKARPDSGVEGNVGGADPRHRNGPGSE